MDRFRALPRGAQLMLVAGVLLLVSTFLPWQRVEVLDFTAVSANAWNGFWGVVLGLLTIALVAWLVIRLLGVELGLPVSDTMIGVVLGSLIFLFALIKVLSDDFTAAWAWIGLVLAALVAVGSWVQVQDSGGVDTLRSEAGAMKESVGSAPAGQPPAPPAAPEQPPAAAEPPSPSSEPRDEQTP